MKTDLPAGDGLGMLPRPREPESAMLAGMASPAPQNAADELSIPSGYEWRGRLGSFPDTSVPGSQPGTSPQNPTWEYDLDSGTLHFTASFAGDVFITGDLTVTGTIHGGSGVVGWTPALNTTAPNDTINVSSFLPSGGTTNQSAALTVKGTGALTGLIPDGTAAGGNPRGTNAVDWQLSTTAAVRVASGNNAAIGGGDDNEASGNGSTVAGGESNSATGHDTSVGGGFSNLASGNNSTVSGGDSNTASGADSTIGGGTTNQASAANATVAGGTHNQASTLNATVAGGNTNVASGSGSAIGGGDHNTASGSDATVAGGNLNTADGDSSWIPGGQNATTRGITGYGAVASGQFSALGDAQLGILPLRAATTDATPTVLTSDGGAASASNQLAIPDNSTFGFHGWVIARDSGTGTSAYWSIAGGIRRVSGAATTVLLATVTPVLISPATTTLAIAVTADTTNGTLTITATGVAATNTRWLARIESEELTGF